jgi:hypothetical protein
VLIHGVAEKLPGFLPGTERQQHVAHHLPVRKQKMNRIQIAGLKPPQPHTTRS